MTLEGTWPVFEQDEIEAARRVLTSGRTNYWTGDECQKFEKEFASYHGVGHAVTVANGTLALELALRALGVGQGDEVIVTPRSFFASASCVMQVGARPVFADVDRDSQNLTSETIERVISPETKAIIPVHLAGWPCDMPAIMELAREREILVIEDCAQAHGAQFNGKPVGSFGDAGAFSFCQDKIMSTAGEGGMLLIDDEHRWRRAWEFRDHGKNIQKVLDSHHPLGFRWLHDSFGSNWRLTEIQGAIGRIQLKKLRAWVDSRRANARLLAEGLNGLSLLRIPRPREHEFHAYYKFYAFVEPDCLKTGWTRDRILCEMDAAGIPGLSGACPEIYRETAFSGEVHARLRTARELGETSLMLMVHPTLTETDVERMIGVVRDVCCAATR